MLLALAAMSIGSVHLLAPEKVVVQLGREESARISLVLSNGSSEAIQFWRAGFWPNHRLDMTTPSGDPVLKTKTGQRGARLFGSPDRGKNSPIVVPVGKKYKYETPSLLRAFVLRRGEYELSVHYKDESFGNPLELSTRKVKVVVK